jgi:hypothetical protein
MIYEHPNFGKLNLYELEERYDSVFDFEDLTVEIDLNFEEKIIKPNRIEIVNTFLNNLNDFHQNNILKIQKDYKKGGEAKFYAEEMMEYLEEDDELNLCFPNTNRSLLSEEFILSKLYLKRIGFYPNDKDYFAVFDYTIHEEMNYLLVLKYNQKQKISEITVES